MTLDDAISRVLLVSGGTSILDDLTVTGGDEDRGTGIGSLYTCWPPGNAHDTIFKSRLSSQGIRYQ